MPVQNTSIISYISIVGELGKRQKECLVALKQLRVANNLMISKFMHLPINQVVPRIYELRKKGIVRLNHVGACPFTKETTRFYSIVGSLNEVMI